MWGRRFRLSTPCIKARSITVIIPCLNEEQGIERILRAMPEFVDEVIVVDNASTDRTSDVAATAGRQGDPRGCARLRPQLTSAASRWPPAT